MQLPSRDLPFEVPKYSLTGDVLSFQRCGLQYRYYNRSSLPPSRPVQLWTGEFVHGMMEEMYLYWQQNRTPFPWPFHQTSWGNAQTQPNRVEYDLGVLGDRVEARLRASGKTPRNRDARNAAYRRVEAAMNLLVPYLFPLITAVEEKLSSTRPMPMSAINAPQGQQPRGDRYELTGVVDVISSVSLETQQNNPLVEMINHQIPGLSGEFDVIVDYKAARRPPMTPPPNSKPYWQHEAWQVQTYAWLRAQQPHTNPVRAGLLIYVNELSPSQSDLNELGREINQGLTDVVPAQGDENYYALNTWQSGQGQPIPNFTSNFLLERAVRIVSVAPTAINGAVTEIDNVIAQIEGCALHENATGNIPRNWNADGGSGDCDACDFRRFCPSPASTRQTGQPPRPPVAPG
ncbi:MAG: PD-(D/E)XK nuclease family protein [Cyanobacteriota bacterium]|nr:PD-(D/E)XK nuclease family protein [Cyanobacteriota bacterium]